MTCSTSKIQVDSKSTLSFLNNLNYFFSFLLNKKTQTRSSKENWIILCNLLGADSYAILSLGFWTNCYMVCKTVQNHICAMEFYNKSIGIT